MKGSAVLVAFTAMIVLAGCGSSPSHRAAPLAGDALAAAIRADDPGGHSPSKLDVHCQRHTCTMSWDDLLDATNGWAVALGTVVDVASDFGPWSLHHLDIRIYDFGDRRVATFSCDPRVTAGTASVASHSKRDKVAGCLETDRRLSANVLH